MNILKKYILVALAALSFAPTIAAQDNGSSSAAVVRRRNPGDDRQRTATPGVTQRMETFYQDPELTDADMQWMRVIYRQLDLDNNKNAALYYPEDIVDGQENLFRIIMRLVTQGRIPAYEYLDGREIFNDQYRLNVKDMLDRFYILYTPGRNSTERNPTFQIEEADVPTNEVLSYYIIERWEFDSRSNRMKTRVEAICPVLHRSGDFGGDAIRYPMFWVKLENLRPHLAQQSIFIDDDNNLAKYTYDDFFAMNMYEGDIYKTRNLQNRSMVQLYPDPDDRRRAQDSIQNRLQTFDQKLWVPDREQVIAEREAREAAAQGQTVSIPERDETAAPAPQTRSRSRSKAKANKPKQPKADNSGSAVRSVRRRK